MPHLLEWTAQGIRYAQILGVVCNLVVSASDGSTRQLRSILPFVNWLGMTRSDLSEGADVYFGAFYAACAWTSLLGVLFLLGSASSPGS